MKVIKIVRVVIMSLFLFSSNFLFSQKSGNFEFYNSVVPEVLMSAIYDIDEEFDSQISDKILFCSYLNQVPLKGNQMYDTIYKELDFRDTLDGIVAEDYKVLVRKDFTCLKFYKEGVEFLFRKKYLFDTDSDLYFVNFYMPWQNVKYLNNAYTSNLLHELSKKMLSNNDSIFDYLYCIKMFCQIQKALLENKNKKYISSYFRGEKKRLDSNVNLDSLFRFTGEIKDISYVKDSLFYIFDSRFNLGFNLNIITGTFGINHISFCLIANGAEIKSVHFPCVNIGVEKDNFNKVFSPLENSFLNLLIESFMTTNYFCGH